MPLPLIAWAAIAAGSAAASYAGYKLVGDDDDGKSERTATQKAEREAKARQDQATARREIQRRQQALALASKQVALELKALGIQCQEPLNKTRLRRLRLKEIPPSSEVTSRIERLAKLTGRNEDALATLAATLTVVEPQLAFGEGADSLDARLHDCQAQAYALTMFKAIDDCLAKEIART